MGISAPISVVFIENGIVETIEKQGAPAFYGVF